MTLRARSCPTCRSIGDPRVVHEDQLCTDRWHDPTPSDSQDEPRRRDDAALTAAVAQALRDDVDPELESCFEGADREDECFRAHIHLGSSIGGVIRTVYANPDRVAELAALALRPHFEDLRAAVARLESELATARRDRNRARRCLREHADCDDLDCRAEIEAALGVGPDPVDILLEAARADVARLEIERDSAVSGLIVYQTEVTKLNATVTRLEAELASYDGMGTLVRCEDLVEAREAAEKERDEAQAHARDIDRQWCDNINTCTDGNVAPAIDGVIADLRDQLRAAVENVGILEEIRDRRTAERDEARALEARVWDRIRTWQDDPETRLRAFALTAEKVEALEAERDALRADLASLGYWYCANCERRIPDADVQRDEDRDAFCPYSTDQLEWCEPETLTSVKAYTEKLREDKNRAFAERDEARARLETAWASLDEHGGQVMSLHAQLDRMRPVYDAAPVLAEVARMYLAALDEDPENGYLTLPEAFKVTMVRDALAAVDQFMQTEGPGCLTGR